MTKTLFHGSDHVIVSPQFGAGKFYNDYGPGFYCTEHSSMASEWAVGINHDGYVNEYQIDLEGLTIVNLDDPQFTTIHWLGVLLQNRWFDVRSPLAIEAREYILEHFHVPLENADIVEGYRADDSYFAFAQDFITGAISYRQLQNAMKLGDLGRQAMIKSPEAFDRLKFITSHAALRSTWLPRREQRDREAREKYFSTERNARKKGDLFIHHIIDEEMRAADDRLR